MKLQNFTSGYCLDHHQSLDFEFQSGQKIALLGANGAGKSCLLKTLVGLLDPRSGQADLHSISYLSQSGFMPDPTTVLDYLSLIDPVDQDIYSQALAKLDVKSLLQRSLSTLSGGELQRVRLIATLMQDSHLYVLDEPTLSLDPRPTAQLSQCLTLKEFQTKSLLFTTHDLNFALDVANSFWLLHDGQLYFYSDVAQLKEQKGLELAFKREFEWLKSEGGQWRVF